MFPEAVTEWLKVTTWRRVHVYQHADRFTAEAYEYPHLDNRGEQIAAGHGETPDIALERLGQRLARNG